MVSRPEPPSLEPRSDPPLLGDPGPEPPPPPEPAGPLDEIVRTGRVLATFAGDHLHLTGLILILLLAVIIGSCGRSTFGVHYVQ